jgi:ABC-type uncharacterized transport system substrate-binding protein
VFNVGADPVQFGLVASLNRPGGNLTGVNAFEAELGAKALALLHDLVPSAATIGFLENPNNPISELTTRDVLAAAPVAGVKVQILKASTDREIDAAFVSLVQGQTGALFVGGDFLFNSRIEQVTALAVTELVAKQLELSRELLPRAARVAVFVNPASATAETTLRDVEPAARAIGLQIQILRASTSREIDTAFETFARERPDALFISNDTFLNSRRVQLVQLAAHHRVPAFYSGREYSEIGGLMSYGTNIADAYRQVGVYAGRILKGAKPADLPVVQSSKFELVINHQTARMLGLTVPDKLLALADEVIE